MMLALLSGLLLTACNKEEDTAPSPEELLMQEVWTFGSLRIVIENEDGILSDETGTLDGTVDFRPDNTVVTASPGDEPVVDDWILTPSTLTIGMESLYVIELTAERLLLRKTYEAPHPDDPALGRVQITEEVTLLR